MPKQNVYLQSFGVGVVDANKLPRTDLERMRLAAEVQTNLLSTVSGSMFLRPGTRYLGQTLLNSKAVIHPFVFSSDDSALLELSANKMRVFVDDALVAREEVETNVNNQGFAAVGSWVLSATNGAESTISEERLRLRATSVGAEASASQEVEVRARDRGKEHALSIKVDRGEVVFRVGSNLNNDTYVRQTILTEGDHSIAFTPTTESFQIMFETSSPIVVLISQCKIEGPGAMEIDTRWTQGRLPYLRFTQSADVIFVASGVRQYKIERRGTRSWSVVKYKTGDGPFYATKTEPVRLRPGSTRGNTTLTSSAKFFTTDHIGGLFYLYHSGQVVSQSIVADGLYTDPIRVTGVDGLTASTNDRQWRYTVEGTWAGTLTVQRSFDSEDYGYKGYRNSSQSETIGFATNVADVLQYDSDDNAIVYYRIGFEDGDFTSGKADITLSYGGGGGFGVCRVTGFNSRTSVDIEILTPFKNTTWTDSWREGMWSDKQGWPTAVTLSEGRLFWAGNDKVWGSVSDEYESFDEETDGTNDGDSAAINRSIAIGSVNEVKAAMSLQRLVLMTDSREVVAKSSSFDEPLTPTAFTLKASSSVGSCLVEPVGVDGRGVFVDRTKRALFELVFDGNSGDYAVAELTRMCSSFFSSGVVKLGVSRRPDTRIWAILESGDCMCMVYEPAQEVVSFIKMTTQGAYESVAVVPGESQDFVYFVVRRSIGGEDRRYIERMASDVGVNPTTIAFVMDACETATEAVPTTTLTGLRHLRGKQVKVWADGAPFNETTIVAGTEITVPKLFDVSETGTVVVDRPVTRWVAGLAYQGVYRSARLAYAAAGGTAMLQKKRINEIGLILSDYVRSGIKYGRDADNMFPLPKLNDWSEPDDVQPDTVTEERPVTFDGGWNTDARVRLTADWPAQFLGLVMSLETNG